MFIVGFFIFLQFLHIWNVCNVGISTIRIITYFAEPVVHMVEISNSSFMCCALQLLHCLLRAQIIFQFIFIIEIDLIHLLKHITSHKKSGFWFNLFFDFFTTKRFCSAYKSLARIIISSAFCMALVCQLPPIRSICSCTDCMDTNVTFIMFIIIMLL